MKKHLFIIVFQLVSALTFAQDDVSKRYASSITPTDLKDRLSIIASDALEGRMTGSRGQKMAAAFISDHFRRLGLQAPVNGSYYQPFDLYTISRGEIYLQASGTSFAN